ncbi:MAG: 3'-5' exoribonuclease YhaM family protein [Desulfobacterales bacterium]
MKKRFVDTLTPGENLDDVFRVSDKRMSQKRDGSPYLSLVLSDKTGSVAAVMWDVEGSASFGLRTGDPVRINGTVSEYKGTLQVVVRSLEKLGEEAVEAADFLPSTSMDVDALLDRLQRLTASMETPWLKALFEQLWADAAFVERFRRAPAAKMMHHAYLGGLLVHCLSMAVLADRIAAHYSGIDRDLLVAGAILHDIGKTEEFDYETALDYSSRGRLLSHIVIGLQIIDAKLASLPDVPPGQADLLRHMIVSHHGEREFGALEPPKTLEAVLLHFIDEMDSKVNAIREFMAKEDPSDTWTGYHRLLGRHFLMPKPDETE